MECGKCTGILGLASEATGQETITGATRGAMQRARDIRLEEPTMQRALSKAAIIGAAFTAVLGITVLVTGQPASEPNSQPASPHLVGVVDDWSHHHLVFSNPGTYEQAVKTGASYAKWLTIRNDTRYILQQIKRHSEAASGLSGEMSTGGAKAPLPSSTVDPQGLGISVFRPLQADKTTKPKPPPRPNPRPTPPRSRLKRDWDEALLTGMVQPNTYPAKFGTSLTSASCSDFVVFPTGAAGTGTTATIVAHTNLYPELCSGNVPSVLWAYNTAYSTINGNDLGAVISTSPVISADGSQVAFVQSDGTYATLVLLKWNPTPAEQVVSGVVWAKSNTITLISGSFTAADVGAQISDGNNAIPAGDTIYSVSGNTATLTMQTNNVDTIPEEPLTIIPETLETPGIPPDQDGSYQGCVAPCMYTWPLSKEGYGYSGTLTNDSFSAPFYDYGNDVLYVGDDSGRLHKFTGVFNGTPTEEGPPGPWPVHLSSTALSSPVYDSVSGYVFVGDLGGNFWGEPANGGASVGIAMGGAIIDAPLVDSSAEMAYVFTTDSSGNNAVFQCPITKFGSTSTSVGIGTGNPGYFLYAGTFDNVYYESAGATGNLYVVGNTGVTDGATLYQIQIVAPPTSMIPIPIVTGLTASGAYPWPSPLSEFCNNGSSPCGVTTGDTCGDGITCTYPGTDYLFFSVNAGTVGSNCTDSSGNGCVLSYNISNPSSLPSPASFNVATPASPGCWATGGIVIDNSDTTYGAQVYFINLNGVPAGGAGGPTSSSCGSGQVLLMVTGSTTAGINTVTLQTSGSVPKSYVGALISDADGAIPPLDTITAVTDTTLTLANAATVAASGDTLIIAGGQAVQASQSGLN